MNLFKQWSNLNYCNPNELQTTLNLSESETYDFFKSLKIKKNKVKIKKNENEMKKKIQIDFTKSILDFYN